LDEGEVFRRLEAADWAAIGKALRAYAMIRSMRYPGRTAGLGELGLGKTIEDIVHDVIEKTINRTRKWDPELGDLLPWLERQVDSLMDHLHKRWHYRHETHLEAKDAIGQVAVETIAVEQHAFNTASSAQNPRPEDALTEQEDEADHIRYVSTHVQRAYEAADGDSELVQLLDLCMAHGKDCERIAEEAGVPVEDIYRRIRKLRRRIKSREPQSPERMKNDETKGAGH
jgi:DNA-directed RNA polymerase specialized sigma24 family protein